MDGRALQPAVGEPWPRRNLLVPVRVARRRGGRRRSLGRAGRDGPPDADVLEAVALDVAGLYVLREPVERRAVEGDLAPGSGRITTVRPLIPLGVTPRATTSGFQTDRHAPFVQMNRPSRSALSE